MTTLSITSGQVRQILRFGSDAIEKILEELGLDKNGAQRVIEHGDDFSSAIRAATSASLKNLSVSDRFKEEEIESSYAYPSDYKVKGITEQTNILRGSFPDIGYAHEYIANKPLPPNAEGWFVIPRWEKIAPTYCEAVKKVLAIIGSKRKFYNYREGQSGPQYLRQHARTVKMFQRLGDEQKDYDILIVPAQFGLRHRGRSVRRAREVFAANEFGLGAFAIACMLLTHPEREVQWEQLHVDCAGDEFAPGADGVFHHAPDFRFDDGEVEFSTHWVSNTSANDGSASGFFQQ